MSTLFAALSAPLLVPRMKPTRVIGAVRAMFRRSAEDARPARIHYPPDLKFFEQAAMARELRRL